MGTPLCPRETWNQEGGLLYTGDFEWWMKESSRTGAALSQGTPWGGPGARAPSLGTPKDMLKRHITRDVIMPCMWVSLSIGAPLGNLEGIHLLGLFERKGSYVWDLFLDPEDIKILSLGAIWNFGKGTGLSWADIRLWGTKGPSIRPRCIGTIRAQTKCKSIYALQYSYEW
jgi:hypothetical protein